MQFRIVITQYHFSFPLCLLAESDAALMFPYLYNLSNSIFFRKKYECVSSGKLKTEFVHAW